MMSGFNVVIGDDDDRDSSQLLAIFPKEIWLMILNNIQSAEELRNTNNASPFFHRLLQPRRVTFLFPQVWEILGDSIHQGDEHEFIYARRQQPLRNPSTDPPRWCSEILPLRQVCVSWMEGIDQLYYQRSVPIKDLKYNRWFSEENKIENVISFDWVQDLFYSRPAGSTRSITSFLAHFESTHSRQGITERSPFVSSKVNFYVHRRKDWANYQRFATEITQLLSKYGSYIRICNFCFYDAYVNPETLASLLEWLPLLPNLASLEISFGPSYSVSNLGFPDLYERLPDRMRTELIAQVGVTPWPKLQKLQYLLVNNLASCVANPLIRSNSHVAVLRIKLGRSDPGCDIYTVPFPNLKELLITYHSMCELQKLETSQFSNSFEKLYVTFATEQAVLLQMFQVWGRKWAESLTHLQLMILPPTADGFRKKRLKECEKFQKEFLPRVKQLQLYIPY